MDSDRFVISDKTYNNKNRIDCFLDVCLCLFMAHLIQIPYFISQIIRIYQKSREKTLRNLIKVITMKYPGMGDPYKRKKTIKFLLLSAIIGGVAVLLTSLVVNPIIGEQPHNACINDIDTNWNISFTFEMIKDGQRAEVQPNIGITEGGCQRAIYTLSNDGTVYAEWIENPNFELGHFLYISKFEIRDMEESKTKIYVNDVLSESGLKTPLQDKYHYKGVFTTKDYDSSKDKDFLPELEN